ncbi:MAG: Ig-like domain-containing protein [Candidatus Woesearchaeota archaeon]
MLALLVLALATPALAEIDIRTYESNGFFTVSATRGDWTTCQCGLTTADIEVENTGGTANRFTLETPDVPGLSVSESRFELLPGESRTVTVFINAPCDAEYDGEAEFKLTDVFGHEFAFTKQVTISQCQNLAASLASPDNGSLAPCESKRYSVYVENTGSFPETYEVRFGGDRYGSGFDKPAQRIDLQPGQAGVANATMKLDCDVSGDVTVPFTVEASKNGLVTTLKDDIHVRPEYDYNLGLDVPGAVCAGNERRATVTIENQAALENSYSLSLAAPGFATLERDSVTLAPGEEADIPITIDPSLDRAGGYELAVRATSDVGGVTEVSRANLSVVDCYGVSANVDLDEPVRECSGYHEFPVVIENTGAVEQHVALSVNGTEYARLGEDELDLEHGDESSVTLILDVPPGVSLDADVVVKASVVDVPVTAQDTLRVDMADERECFRPSVWPRRESVSYAGDNATFRLMNDGLDTAVYEASWQGHEWFGIAEEDRFTTLRPGEEADLSLLTYREGDVPEADRYEGTLRVFVRSVDGDRVISYDAPVSVRLHGVRVWQRAADFASAKPCLATSLGLVVLALAFGIALLARPARLRRRFRGFAWSLFFVWIVLLGLTLILAPPQALYEPVPEDDDPLTFTIPEDTSLTLNLSEYFEDPDMDELQFMVSGMANVTREVDNATATLTPDPDWFGERRFRVTAFDGEGGSTESPRMLLRVVERPEYTPTMLYQRYCW